MASSYADPEKERAWRERGMQAEKERLVSDPAFRERRRKQKRESMAKVGATSEGRRSQREINLACYNRAKDWAISWFNSIQGKCTWCSLAMKPYGGHSTHVDHNSSCHSRWQQAMRAQCSCIRGIVHTTCNTRYIAVLEPLWRMGDIEIKSPYMRDYFEQKLGPFPNVQ
jgi:hypothetical protein